MQMRMGSFYLRKNLALPVSLFCYRNKGLPGIEIVGAGDQGKLIKEKLLYVSKENQVRLPLYRYVLCVERRELSAIGRIDFSHLEFPLLLMLWSLAEKLALKKTDDCIGAGTLSSESRVGLELMDKIANKKITRNKILLLSRRQSEVLAGHSTRYIVLEKLLSDQQKLQFQCSPTLQSRLKGFSQAPRNFARYD